MTRSPLAAHQLLLAGARLASENARGHRTAAGHLAVQGLHGCALAHLVFAVEEAGKAQLLTDRAMNVGFFGEKPPTPEETRRMLRRTAAPGARLTAHHLKQRAAATQSWSWPHSRVLAEMAGAGLLSPGQSFDDPRIAQVFAAHPEVLAADWDGEGEKHVGLYVDVDELRPHRWSSPSDVDAARYADLEPRVEAAVRAQEERVATMEEAFALQATGTGPTP